MARARPQRSGAREEEADGDLQFSRETDNVPRETLDKPRRAPPTRDDAENYN
jgi:hypothetical protein